MGNLFRGDQDGLAISPRKRAGVLIHLQLHQPLGGEANHLAQQISGGAPGRERNWMVQLSES